MHLGGPPSGSNVSRAKRWAKRWRRAVGCDVNGCSGGDEDDSTAAVNATKGCEPWPERGRAGREPVSQHNEAQEMQGTVQSPISALAQRPDRQRGTTDATVKGAASRGSSPGCYSTRANQVARVLMRRRTVSVWCLQALPLLLLLLDLQMGSRDKTRDTESTKLRSNAL
ncbi:hypothetical protein V8C42DRAFT_77680 [Trichoderma barbatum]